MTEEEMRARIVELENSLAESNTTLETERANHTAELSRRDATELELRRFNQRVFEGRQGKQPDDKPDEEENPSYEEIAHKYKL